MEEGPGRMVRAFFHVRTRELNLCIVNALLSFHRLPIWFVLRQTVGQGACDRLIG